MREADFAALTAACDSLLKSPTSTLERVALPWLHVLSEHPNNLAQYADLFGTVGVPASVRRKGGRAIRVAKKMGRWLASPALEEELGAGSLPTRVDVLIISHLISAAANPAGPDFYFGQLADQLAAVGLRSLVALHDHVQLPAVRRRFSRRRAEPRTASLLLPLRLSLMNEARMLRRANAAAASLRDEAAGLSAFDAAVTTEASRRCLGAATLATLRVHEVVRTLCARLRPRAILLTWEGHGWERIAFHAARSVDPTIKCVGYQHTVLFPRSHAVARALGGSYDPDVLLTLGEITRDRIIGAGNFSDVPVRVYGSHRRAPAADVRPPDFSRPRCLVLPEGLEMECVRLFQFAADSAIRNPEITFVFRTHPVLPIAQLARDHKFLRELPANVEISRQGDIRGDLATCAWAFYRGSSAILHAVLSGLRPVYIEGRDELAFDPLFALPGWRCCIWSTHEFASIVAADTVANPRALLEEWEPARRFCERYVTEPQPAVFTNLLRRDGGS